MDFGLEACGVEEAAGNIFFEVSESEGDSSEVFGSSANSFNKPFELSW